MTAPRPTRTRRMWEATRTLRRWLRRVVAVGSCLVVAFAIWVVAVPFPEEALAPEAMTSAVIVDRDGRLLREVLSADDARARWVGLDDISPHLTLATIHAEDKRFRDHIGVDGLAVIRSALINVHEGRAATGASTLTQQTVKMTLLAGRPRNIGTKIMEAVWAMRLELALDKDAILAQYLNRVPYGNQLYGAEAAAWMYFGKPAAHLSLAEAALLAGIPQSPTHRNPYRDLPAAKRKQEEILGWMLERGAIDQAAHDRSVAEPLQVQPRRGAVRAPHFTDEVLRRVRAAAVPTIPSGGASSEGVIRTTLDLDVQRRVEAILAQQRPEAARHGDPQAAAVVLDTASGEVLAWVGSRDYGDAARLGANDGVVALRQPGSTLKPFVYGAWLDDGGLPTEILPDLPTAFETPTGLYRPQNFDRQYHGPVLPRDALGSSLNIPAVAVAERVGVGRLLGLLRGLGMDTLVRSEDHYGLGLALGNGEVRLLDLAAAYATLGRLGRPVAPRLGVGDGPVSAEDAARAPILSPQTAYTLLDWLTDDDARGVGFGVAGPFALPYRVAAKTGTSSGFRDNWAVGVTPDYTVAVWVGHFDGRGMPSTLGRVGAAPTLRQILQSLYPRAARRGDVAWFTAPAGLARVEVCKLTGGLATAACPNTASEWTSPEQRARLEPDDSWVRVAIDRRNGLQAGVGCVEDVAIESRVRLPDRYRAWAAAQRLPVLPEGRSPRCDSASAL